MKKTYYFNTGVKPSSGAGLYGVQIWKDGVKQIPFTCENVPDNARFLFACDNDSLPESKLSGIIVTPILDSGAKGGIQSKYAYFKVRD